MRLHSLKYLLLCSQKKENHMRFSFLGESLEFLSSDILYRKEQVLRLSGRFWNWTWASWWEAGSVKGCSWVRPDCAGIGQVWSLQPLTVIKLLKRKIENSGDGERRASERIIEGRNDWESNEKDEWRVSHRPLSASYILFSIFSKVSHDDCPLKNSLRIIC